MTFSLDPFQKKKALPKGFLQESLQDMISGKMSNGDMLSFFTALELKGTRDKDIADLVHFFSPEKASDVLDPQALTLALPCSTPHESLVSFCCALLVSSMGLPVIFQGDSSLITSLGVSYQLDGERKQMLFEKTGLSLQLPSTSEPFQKLHKKVSQQLSFPTLLDRLQSLLQVSRTRKHCFSFSGSEEALLLQTVQKRQGVHTLAFKDDISTGGTSIALDIQKRKKKTTKLSPQRFGLPALSASQSPELSRRQALKCFQDILSGDSSSRYRDDILIRSSLILKSFLGKRSLKKYFELAKEHLESGKVAAHFSAFLFLQDSSELVLYTLEKEEKKLSKIKTLSLRSLQKKATLSEHRLRKLLSSQKLRIIPEISVTFPQEKKGLKGKKKPEDIACELESLGADAFSVWTRKESFGGSYDLLSRVKRNTRSVPLLCKDFFLKEHQVYEARVAGADAILLIASLLPLSQMQRLLKTAEELGMDCVVEVRSEQELMRSLEAGATIVQLQKTELLGTKTLKLNLQKLAKKIPRSVSVIVESAFDRRTQIQRLPKKTDAVSVSRIFMKKSVQKDYHQLFGKQPSRLSVLGVQTPAEARACLRQNCAFLVLDFRKKSPGNISYQKAQKILEVVRKQSAQCSVYGWYDDTTKDSELTRDVRQLSLDGVLLGGKRTLSSLKKLPVACLFFLSLQRASDLKKAERLLKYCDEVILDIDVLSNKPQRLKKLLPKNSFPFILHSSLSPQKLSSLFSKDQEIPFLGLSLPLEGSQKERKIFLQKGAEQFC
jgi:indole-3-glycerol phosphate synthase